VVQLKIISAICHAENISPKVLTYLKPLSV
jgi:hypothetical protein